MGRSFPSVSLRISNIMSGLLPLLLIPLVSSYPQSYDSVRQYNQGYEDWVTKSGGDIIKETRTQAESLKTTLKYLASTAGPAEILNRIINDKNNVCLNSVEEAIEAVEASTKIVEDAAQEIKQLIESIKI